ncbi:IS30 family transposase [Egicoccus sp. AB-alg2]|uniref:IS30 family transposase n=1 Tax=Egicoccus sp. AB-alg2 TaxID=3242693 RepID=UPI00359CE197
MAIEDVPYNLTAEQVVEFWDGYMAGQTVAQLARRFGKKHAPMYERVQATGGIRPTIPTRAARHLTLEDREEISRGLAAGDSLRRIADRLGRCPSTISREVEANGGRRRYRAAAADRAAIRRRRRPKPCKLAATPQLAKLVEAKLKAKWSPEQIAGWLKRTYPGRAELQVSHETIYRTLYVQSRGALKRELTEHLRTKRRIRRPGNGNRQRASGSGNLVGMIRISERPAEAEDRAVPGHWEGDLILGKGMSAIGTLVERSSRFLLLFHLERIKSEHVVAQLTRHVQTLPVQLRRSVTWDQGKEMALHATFTIDTGIQVYFCDPKSPWQRGTNENTNGLLRQYFPKRSDLKPYSQADLDAIAAELNGRPRKTLQFMTPSEKFAEAVAATR